MRARRALLYMPGDELHKIRKAATLGVDCACMDMEDGVAINRKAEARLVIVQALQTLDFGRSERLVRINAIGSGLEVDDLEALFGEGSPAALPPPDGMVVPKVESPEQVLWIHDRLAQAEKRFGWAADSLALIIQIETARGLVNVREVLAAKLTVPRLQAVIFGAEDLASDMGMTRTRQGAEVAYARGAIVAHAAAFDLQAIDMVYVDFHDRPGLEAEARQGAEMGYAGKQIIHPAQVEPVQAAFTPGAEAVAHARRVMEAFEAHQRQGRGAFALDGKMVDLPVVKAAQRVLERARAAGL
jgi:citrate lyase beta subunit